jgi:hypothetical protein
MTRFIAVVALRIAAATFPTIAAFGDPEAANQFAAWYTDKFTPGILRGPSTDDTTTATTSRSASFITDFQLVCFDASQAEVKLFGDEYAQY